MQEVNYRIGDRVQIIDRIDPDIVETGTLKYLEFDRDGFVWAYVVSDNERPNDKIAFNFRYWQIVNINDPYMSIA